MAKWINDGALDALLDYVIDSDQEHICSQQPATYTEATSTYSLGYASVDSGDFTKSDDVSGRKVTVAEQSVTPTGTGSADHVALVKTTGSILKYVTTCPVANVETGVAETVASFTVNPRDPDPAYQPPPDPDPPPTGLLQGDSGLEWNSIMFPASGDMDTKRATFETWLGHPLDGLMWFVPRDTWTEMQWLEPEGVATTGYKVICTPTQPQTQNNAETASGSRNSWWEAWGQSLTNAGLNTSKTIIRLNWEANANAWYPWTWDRPSVSDFVAAWTNAAKSIRVNAPNVLFNLNHSENNFDNAAAGNRTWAECTDLILPYKDAAGKPLLNIVGIDSYNHSPGVRYPSNANASQRAANWWYQTNRTSGDFVPDDYDPPTRGSVYQYAVDHTQADGSPLWFWHDEWGACHSEWNSGGDDPYFFEFMWDWFYERRISNGGRLLGECIYNDDGAPSDYRHTLMSFSTGQPTSYNYNGALKYKQLWQPA